MAPSESHRRPVVVAVSDPEHADSALRFGAAEAALAGCPLHLLHAFGVPPGGPGFSVPDAEAHRRAGQTVRAALDRARTELGDRLRITGGAVQGPIVERIVQAGDGARMVVLQRRDLAQLVQEVTRSTSTAVAAHAHVPVIVVPDGWTEGGVSGPVTVGVDVPSRSEEVLRQGLLAAEARRAPLRIVHAWWSPLHRDGLPANARLGAEWRTEAGRELDAVLSAVRPHFPNLDVEIALVYGRPAEQLVEASRTSSLLVVGRHDPLVPPGSQIGPVAQSVLREAECPVLMVGPRPPVHARAQGGAGDAALGARRPAWA